LCLLAADLTSSNRAMWRSFNSRIASAWTSVSSKRRIKTGFALPPCDVRITSSMFR